MATSDEGTMAAEGKAQAERLATAARGGSVSHTGFLGPDESARLVHELISQGVNARAWGGYPGARRRVVTSFPSHVPDADTPLAAVYLELHQPSEEILAAVLALGVAPGALGDVLSHQSGTSLITLDPPPRGLLELERVAGSDVKPQLVAIDRAAAGSVKRTTAVVASLRIDALGAKAFKMSRSYFAKGVAGGKVSVNGRSAGKSTAAEPGDEIYAEGLGRLRVLSIDGETRRGNVKVSMEIESAVGG